MDPSWVKKFRILTFSLIFSGALNIGLLAAVIAFSFQPSLGCIFQKAPDQNEKPLCADHLQELSKKSFRELVACLTDRAMVEQGYTKRDLALSALVANHHFDVERALGVPLVQKREIAPFELYPGLTEEQFAAIIRFAYQEKWPLSPKGLFSLLQKVSREASLEQAFSHTPQFFALQLLFQKTQAAQDCATLINLAAEGTWELLDGFAKEQTQLLDLSVEKRRRLLLSYLTHRSETAAQLLIKTDAPFALKRLDDQGMVDLLTLLTQKTAETEAFCASLLQSPRGNTVLSAAREKVSNWGGIVAKIEEPVAVETAAVKYHVVGEGESLWRIAREHKVKVDDIVLLNDIDKDKLFPGMTLKIPN